MKGRIFFTIKYFIFWVCAFVIARIIFLLYQHNQSFDLSADVWFGIAMNGLKLDLSTAGYFTLLPSLILCFTSFSSKPGRTLIGIYTFLLLFVFVIITIVDFEAYKYWGARLDSTPMRFLGKPREALASSSLITIVLYLAFLFLGLWGLFKVYSKTVAATLKKSGRKGIAGFLIQLTITALLILPIRGGISVSPINTGSVYFSKIAFANHAALNVVWNFGQSFIEGKETHNPYVFFKEENYDAELKKLYENRDSAVRVLSASNPRILIIIMETFSAKLIEPLGGVKGITPRFNELCKDGILFSKIYSTDSRTDKGLATIISGYPVLESIPILKYPEKTYELPYLSKSLINAGYHASFLYGGDVDFANMRSYLVNGGFLSIISDSDFPSSLNTGKWGVPDHYFFDRLIDDVRSDTGRWFKVALTLSNHEPFEIPVKPRFGNKNLTEKFFSAAYYADSCLGDFVTRLKQSGKWDNTLVIVVADHGSRLPHFDDIFEPGKHHIPLLFTGGAVIMDSVVAKTGSQADIAYTLLKQLDLPTDGYVLGKDLLSPESQSFAFYSIKNGVAMLTDTSGFGYDFITKDYSFRYGEADSSHVDVARAFQQYVFDHYLNLGNR